MSPWSPTEPYNDLPSLPPRGVDVESKAILKLTVEARTALAKLDQASVSMVNPTVLINSIPLLEAQASSEIENIVTTTDELFRYAQDETGADPSTREALRYRTALQQGHQSVKGRKLITTNVAKSICTTIKTHDMDVRHGTGTYIGNPETKAVIYTPPEGREVIYDKLADWERFVNSTEDLDPLVRMALAHYQFEAIHPFSDGNGRTGRVLNVLCLVAWGLLDLPILYLSRYIIEEKSEYYRLLREVTENESWHEWTEFMLVGVRDTCLLTMRKIDGIREAEQAMGNDLQKTLDASWPAALMNVLFEQPYCRITNVMTACHWSRPTATKWLKALSGAGALVEVKAGRENLYINRRFIDVLTRDDGRPRDSVEG